LSPVVISQYILGEYFADNKREQVLVQRTDNPRYGKLPAVAEQAFAEAGVKLITLSNYEAVIEEAAKTGYIKEDDKAMLAEWRKNPSTWKQAE
jgi:orotate phosphoribosyltransferase